MIKLLSVAPKIRLPRWSTLKSSLSATSFDTSLEVIRYFGSIISLCLGCQTSKERALIKPLPSRCSRAGWRKIHEGSIVRWALRKRPTITILAGRIFRLKGTSKLTKTKVAIQKHNTDLSSVCAQYGYDFIGCRFYHHSAHFPYAEFCHWCKQQNSTIPDRPLFITSRECLYLRFLGR